MSEQGKILVIRGGAIGDFILTLPVLTALRRRFPRTEIHVLGYPHIASLALKGDLAHHVQSIDAPALAGFFAVQGSLNRDLSSYFSTFDVILSYLYDPDGIFQENVTQCTNAQFIAGPHRPVESLAPTASQCLLKPLEQLTIFDANPVPRLPLPIARVHVNVSSRHLVLHPGSGSELKNWPESSWSEFLQNLARKQDWTDWKFLVVGGEAENEKVARLSHHLPVERTGSALHMPLGDLADMMASHGRIFIGHDSGITHLAAALDIPTLVLWGPTNKNVWAPPGDHVRILDHPDGLAHLPVETVLEQVNRIRALLT